MAELVEDLEKEVENWLEQYLQVDPRNFDNQKECKNREMERKDNLSNMQNVHGEILDGIINRIAASAISYEPSDEKEVYAISGDLEIRAYDVLRQVEELPWLKEEKGSRQSYGKAMKLLSEFLEQSERFEYDGRRCKSSTTHYPVGKLQKTENGDYRPQIKSWIELRDAFNNYFQEHRD